ncbi:MAG: D-glycero-beta-D-manno-heptose-7-phosphate kinase [Rhodospirillales bacterium]|nr:D-glycero-beta-D-manno-heptose-7-phosphate kinase [Rhodospirillales bacterium]
MTSRSELAAFVAAFGNARVLCVGDAILDHFIYGSVERISPEAPIPVLRIEREDSMLGGAGNVVRNLVSLGAEVHFISVVGDDPAAQQVRDLLSALGVDENGLKTDASRRTSIKTRYVGAHQQMLRTDRETVAPLPEETRATLVAAVRDGLAGCGVMVLSDYGKGVLEGGVAAELIALAQAANCPVIVDPKGADYTRYRGATLVTPNRKELSEAAGMPANDDDAVVSAAQRLRDGCGVAAVLATRSQDGMTLLDEGGGIHHLKAEARDVFDVSGAGDTVVATMAAAMGGGVPILAGAEIANAAAGIVVGKVGTAAVQADDLVAALHHRDLSDAEARVVTLETASERTARWRAQGFKVGFTNGCFDLLHPGHVSLLKQARGACDRLVVGLNSDASVKRLKGAERPIQNEAARATVLSSLASVDLVVIFGEDTPRELIAALTPDVLVKGADYTVDTVVGADIVQGYGGSVLLADLEQGFSTTGTISRINSNGG